MRIKGGYNVNRKMTISVAVALCLFLSLLSAQEGTDYLTASSDAGSEGQVGAVSVPKANVRYGPDKDKYRIVVTLNKGDKVIVYGSENDWLRIAFPKQGSVWVSAEYVDLVGNSGTINANRVALRDDARFEGLSIGHLNKGAQVTVSSRQGTWYRIVAPSTLYAYIYKDLVQIKGPEYKKADEYFSGKLQEIYFSTAWHKTKEGKDLMALDQQLWSYKAGIRASKSTMEQLDKTFKDVEELRKKVMAIRKSTDNPRVQEQADNVYGKAGEVLEYITSIIEYKKRYEVIMDTYKKNIDKIRNQPDSDKGIAGYIDDIGRVIGRKTPFVIKKGGKIQYFVMSDVYDLKKLYYHEVVVTKAKMVSKNKGGIPVISIIEMEVKGPQPWKNIQ